MRLSGVRQDEHRTAGDGLAVAGLAAVGPCPPDSRYSSQTRPERRQIFFGWRWRGGFARTTVVLLGRCAVGPCFGGDFGGPPSLTPCYFRDLVLDQVAVGELPDLSVSAILFCKNHPLALLGLFRDPSLRQIRGEGVLLYH
jgi:hypothetical protein